jgi:hypothetical protein
LYLFCLFLLCGALYAPDTKISFEERTLPRKTGDCPKFPFWVGWGWCKIMLWVAPTTAIKHHWEIFIFTLPKRRIPGA